jgi:hypothetical protein
MITVLFNEMDANTLRIEVREGLLTPLKACRWKLSKKLIRFSAPQPIFDLSYLASVQTGGGEIVNMALDNRNGRSAFAWSDHRSHHIDMA